MVWGRRGGFNTTGEWGRAGRTREGPGAPVSSRGKVSALGRGEKPPSAQRRLHTGPLASPPWHQHQHRSSPVLMHAQRRKARSSLLFLLESW